MAAKAARAVRRCRSPVPTEGGEPAEPKGGGGVGGVGGGGRRRRRSQRTTTNRRVFRMAWHDLQMFVTARDVVTAGVRVLVRGRCDFFLLHFTDRMLFFSLRIGREAERPGREDQHGGGSVGCHTRCHGGAEGALSSFLTPPFPSTTTTTSFLLCCLRSRARSPTLRSRNVPTTPLIPCSKSRVCGRAPSLPAWVAGRSSAHERCGVPPQSAAT